MKKLPIILALLASLPLAAEPVEVGSFPAKVVPEQLSVLSLPRHGVVSDLAPEGPLKAGTVIAILNKQLMEEEREDMEFQLAKDRIARRDELRQLTQQREKLVFYLKLSDDERKYAGDTLPGDLPPTRESLADIDERIALVNRELDTMAARKRREFERSHEEQTLRMPFDGRLQYNINLPEDRSAPFELVGSVQTFATACDDSSYYVTVGISNSDLSLLPEDKFSVRVSLPEGRELVGRYAYRRVERSRSDRDMLVYFFRLPAEDSETAYSMLGSNTYATLIYEADGKLKRISKSQLAAHPVAAECGSWKELVQRACPGAAVVIIAEHDIVIRPAAGAAEPASPAAPAGNPSPATPTTPAS